MSDPIRFTDLGLSSALLSTLTDIGYETPSPIQAACVPLLLAGRDLIGQAQTGTGKTAAFALPVLEQIDVGQRAPQALVLTPTRELAVQVSEAFQVYARGMRGFHVLPIYGGQAYGLQLKQLRRGPQVVVGTPGRLLDHLGRNTLDLSQLRTLVLDEADEMLRMGFIEDVESIMAQTPEGRATALFSATMPEPIRRISKRYMRDPQEVKIAAKTTTVEKIEQCYWPVLEHEKMAALTRLLEVEEYEGVIIFARTKTATQELAERLEARGYASAALNGDMTQMLRERTVARLKSGQLDIVVATDVAARGLDVERLSLVINYDIPYDTEAYVHRIGRTGRAGREGKAILFVAPRERRLLKAIERAIRQKIPQRALPSGEEVAERRLAKFRDRLLKVFAKEELHSYHQLAEQLASELNLELEDLASALLYLAQKEKPLLVPSEERLTDLTQERPPRGKAERDKSRKPPKAKADKGEKARRRNSVAMEGYRIEVGRAHGVEPKHVVGAIANEAGLDSADIGHIKIHDEYTTVDLPEGMPRGLLKHLQRVYICQRPMRMKPLTEGPPKGGKGRETPRKKGAKRSRPAS